MPDLATNTTSLDTREKILDAAEHLFVEHGFAATSMRAIAQTAEVNLAATNYHFGSKKGLLAAVFQRRVRPINERRLLLLKGLEDSDRLLTLRSILEAFFAPLNENAYADKVPALIGRILAEPQSITKPIMDETFSETAATFQRALKTVLPEVSDEDLRWRFHFMVGSMIQILQFQSPLGTESTHQTFTEGMNQLIEFSIAGLAQANNRQLHD